VQDYFTRAVIPSDAHAIAAHRFVFPFCFIERRAERQHEPFTRHLQQIEAGPARGWFEIGAGGAPELKHLALGIDEHARRRELADRDAVSFALGVEFAGQPLRRSLSAPRRRRGALAGGRPRGSLPWQRQTEGRGRCGFSGKDFLLFVRGREKLGEGADGFARAEEEEASRP
jgi:hypothetical protein